MRKASLGIGLLLIVALMTSRGAAAEQSVTPARGLFVAVGYGGFRGWSADGVHWSAERWSPRSEDDPNIIFALTCRDGVFLCSGGGVGRGFILRSADGKHWDEVVRDKWRIAGVLTLSDRFISVFKDHYQTSTDGVEWKTLADAKPQAPDGVGSGYFRRWAAGKGVVVFAGDYELGNGTPRVGWIGSSHDGTTPMIVRKQPADVRGLIFGNDVFVACTASGDVLRSTDGFEFKKVLSTGDQHDDDAVRFAGGAFFLIGRKGVRRSKDGIEWAPVEHTARLARAIAPDGTAVDCGWGGIDVSTDGTTYRKAQVPVDPTGVCAIVWGVPGK